MGSPARRFDREISPFILTRNTPTMNQIIFLGGMSRSGANLLANILDCHPEIASGPQTGIIDEISYLYLTMLAAHKEGRLSAYNSEEQIRSAIATLIRGVYAPYLAKSGKQIVVDRSPNNIWSFPLLAEILPEAKFIHLIRDGRDVACSQRDVGERLRSAGREVESLRDATLRSISICAAVWAETVRFGWESCGPDTGLAAEGRAFTTFYENIVLSPESQVRNLCDFIGVPFQSSMLYPDQQKHDALVDNIWTLRETVESPISMLSAGRWIDHLSTTDRILFYAQGHAGLCATGYDNSVEWIFRGMNIPVAQASAAIEQAREELLGISQTAQATTVAASESSPARLTIDKIISSSIGGEGALDMALPEVEALVRNAQAAGHTFIGA